MTNINPLVTVSRFAKADKKAPRKDCVGLHVYGAADQMTLEDGLDGLIQLQREDSHQPRWWSNCRYTERHNKDSFEAATAIVLEWHDSAEPELRKALSETMWAHYIIQTEDAKSNRIAVMFPLEEPISDATTYSRAAFILAQVLGVYGLSEGCWAVTFLMQPRPFATVEFQNGMFLNASAFAVRHSKMWVEATKLTGPAPRNIIPANIQALQRASIQRAQIDPPTDTSGLFEW
jgi:hypothetical protein